MALPIIAASSQHCITAPLMTATGYNGAQLKGAPLADTDQQDSTVSIQGAQTVITSVLMLAAIFLFMVFAVGIGVLPAAAVAAICALYTAHLLNTGVRALRADVSEDESLRRQVRIVSRLRPLGVAVCAAIALAVAVTVALGHLTSHEMRALDSAINIGQLREDYEKAHGTGAYRAAMKQLDMTEQELDEHLFGFRYHDALTAVTNPVALGGIAFFGAFACALLLLGGLEVPAMGIGLVPVLAEIQERLDAAGGDGGETDAAPVPPDIQRVVDEDTGSGALHIKPGSQPERTGNARIDALQTILQGTALWHVRLGLIMLGAFGIWTAISLVGVVFDLVS